MNDSARYGVALIPDGHTSNYVRSLANSVTNNLLLNGRTGPPLAHLSLYHFMGRRKDIEHREAIYPMTMTLNDCLPGKPISGKLTALTLKRKKWLYLEAERTTDLLDLQRKVLDRFAPLREGNLPQDKQMSPEMQERYQRYGYIYVEEGFEPHFTYGKIAPNEEIISQPCNAPDWHACQLALAELDDNGQITRIILQVPVFNNPRYAW